MHDCKLQMTGEKGRELIFQMSCHIFFFPQILKLRLQREESAELSDSSVTVLGKYLEGVKNATQQGNITVI